jgi:hypothetical protein
MLLPTFEIEGGRIVRLENRGIVDEQSERPEDRRGIRGEPLTFPLAKVIPLGIFDPFTEAQKRW